jgi:rod shape-determining protein MreC
MRVRTRTWLSFIVVAGVLLMAGSWFSVFDPLENAILSATAPIESALQDGTRPVADFVNNLTDVNRLSDENQNLREQNERLTEEVARLREVETINQQLQQFLDIRAVRGGDVFVSADVFARDPSNIDDAIAIDRGRADGLEEGMVALTLQGSLVGSVTKVLDDMAWITLITDPGSASEAVIQDSRVEGVVVGAADGTLTMEFVEETADVKEGDLVLTAAVGGRYPKGELIGKVVEVERGAQELFQEVRVQPLADLSRLETVLVLKSFLPVEGIES